MTALPVQGATIPVRSADARPLLAMEGVTKRFGAMAACDDVSLSVRAGEVLTLLGENGAGKSTLMKCLYGVHQPDAGRILMDGAETSFRSPRDAMAAHIGMVFQTFALIPALSVAENLALAWPASPWLLGRRMRNAKGALKRLSELAPGVDPAVRVGDLSVAEQQLVELAKVLNLEARLVILDEPTAVLTPAEARRLHNQIRRLAEAGVAVVMITHKMIDVEAVGDRVAVLRRGRIVAEGDASSFDRRGLVTAMVGDTVGLPAAPPRLSSDKEPGLVLSAMSASGPQGKVTDIDLTIARGEIVGIAGVSGNGQSALAEAVSGVLPLSNGDVILGGKSIARRPGDPPKPISIGYLPEEPRANAVAEGLDLATNLQLRAVATGRKKSDENAQRARLEAFDVRPPEPRRLARTLSGGNLQKLVVAREFSEPRSALLLSFPTMGLDVRAAENVYRHMTQAAGDGAAVLWISEEIDDLLAMAHRIGVLYEGKLIAVLPNDGSLDRERLGALMTGVCE